MMTVTLPLYLLLIANAALIVAAAFAVLRVERALQDSAEFWRSPTGAAIKARNPSGGDEQSRLIALRMTALQRAVDALGRREQVSVPERVVDLPLQHALRMAKRGASVGDLTRDCGLNIGEAELLHRLHGQQQKVLPDTTPIARSA